MLDVNALTQHINQHPQLEPQDVIKFLYQGEFGCGHLIPDYSDAYDRFCAEWDMAVTCEENVFEPLNHDFCRVNLGAAKASGIPMSLVLRMFFSSACVCGNKSNLNTQLDYVLSLAENVDITLDAQGFLKELDKYKALDLPLMSHSKAYHAAYTPSYRVIKADYAFYSALFTKMYALMHEKPNFTLVIDGMAASGKTSLATLISTIIPCNVVPADCFFLPSEMRTDERLSQIGGNIHYERLQQEVARKLPCTEDVYYGVFSCKKMAVIGEGRIISGLPVVLEGSYAAHPKAGIKADISVLLTTTPDKQSARILTRNGKTMRQKFESIWIPMENKYLKEFDLASKVDFVFET